MEFGRVGEKEPGKVDFSLPAEEIAPIWSLAYPKPLYGTWEIVYTLPIIAVSMFGPSE